MINKTRIGLACVAAGALTAVGVAYAAGDARADTDATDYAFVQVLRERGIYTPDGNSALILAGHVICNDFIAGYTYIQEVRRVVVHTNLSNPGDAAFLIGASTAAYCSQYNDLDKVS